MPFHASPSGGPYRPPPARGRTIRHVRVCSATVVVVVVVAVRRVDQIIWSMELTMAWARASLSRSTASAARCSVTSVWTPTHSRTALSAPRMGIAQTEKHPHAPPDAVLEQEHAALGDCGVPGVDRRLRIVGMHGG